jgi:TATA-binding protein-associated factor Taf7
MAKKKNLCEECNGELGEDGVCQECGWTKEDVAVEKEVKEEDTDEDDHDGWDEDEKDSEGNEEEY